MALVKTNMSMRQKIRGAPGIISDRISGPDSEIIELSGIRPDISNIRPDTGYFFQGVLNLKNEKKTKLSVVTYLSKYCAVYYSKKSLPQSFVFHLIH